MDTIARWTGIGLVAGFLPLQAQATLGEDVATTQADRIQMKASIRVSQAGRFSVHEIELPSGTVVREYVTPAGKVFAVAWQGPWLPDLRQLLGKSFEPYADPARSKRSGHSSLAIREPDLVVHSTGRMRAFLGQAYIPKLLPQGVSADEIQ